MGKRGAASKHKVKKPVQKTKKNGHFKALTKQETRQVVVEVEKKGNARQPKVLAKRTNPSRSVPDEFRNFDERMAATRMKKQAARAAPAPVHSIVAAPSFVMPAPTFQFNTPAPTQEAPREVEGFHGFIAAMQEPAAAPPPSAQRDARNQKHKAAAPRNVFAVLDDEPEVASSQAAPPVPVPSFLQPATFTFQTATSGSMMQPSTAGLTSLQQSLLGMSSTAPSPFMAGSVESIDPDL